jgi:hypothetical protein
MTTKKTIELVKEGFANGVAPGGPLDDKAKADMIQLAAEHFGNFLDALKCDWRNDPMVMMVWYLKVVFH